MREPVLTDVPRFGAPFSLRGKVRVESWGLAGYNPFRIKESLEEIDKVVKEYDFKKVLRDNALKVFKL